MITRRNGLKALLAGSVASMGAPGSQYPAALGNLVPFYRCTQLQGLFPGMGLLEIPDYLLGQDVGLRYVRKPGFVREIPFADTFTINRFLGGQREDRLKRSGHWTGRLGRRSLDYVVRTGSGALAFRPELIREHLAPYLDAGYRPADMTLALENVPWDVAAAQPPHLDEGPWGQKSPPADLRGWTAIISRFARDLESYLGPESASVGFETGVEYDERVSFDGSPTDFYRYYTATFNGLRAVIPNPVFSPGEFTGVGTCGSGQPNCVYDTKEFLDFARRSHVTVSYVPRSLHSLLNARQCWPSEAVRRAVMSYARIPGVIPEIHQFGLLFQPFGETGGSDPAAVGANWEFQTLIGLWQTIKPRRVFHWGGFVSMGTLHFLNGSGFLRLVLDRYLGRSAFVLKIEVHGPNDAAPKVELMALALSNAAETALILSSFSATMGNARKDVLVQLPHELGSRGTPKLLTISYRASDNVFAAIRTDLANSGNLKPEFVNHSFCLGEPIAMATDAKQARTMVHENWPRYVRAMKNGLKWRAGNPRIRLAGEVLRTSLEGNELLIIEGFSH